MNIIHISSDLSWNHKPSHEASWWEISRISSFVDAHRIWKLPKHHQTNVKSRSNQSRFMTWNPESVYIVLFQTIILFLFNPWLFVEKDGSWHTWGIGSCKQLTGWGRGCCYPSALVADFPRLQWLSSVARIEADDGNALSAQLLEDSLMWSAASAIIMLLSTNVASPFHALIHQLEYVCHLP